MQKTEKTCSKCEISKPLSEFYTRKAAKDGLDYLCKTCVNKYQTERNKTLPAHKETGSNKFIYNAF